MLRWARRIAAVLAASALAWSIYNDVPHTDRVMRSEHARFVGYTRLQREQAFGSMLPLPMDIFDYYRHFLRTGDRYFVQVQPGTFGEFIDKPTAVRTVARIYLLPAIQVSDLAHANVVISFDADPAQLHLRFSEQERAGQQNIFVSRIARGA